MILFYLHFHIHMVLSNDYLSYFSALKICFSGLAKLSELTALLTVNQSTIQTGTKKKFYL